MAERTVEVSNVKGSSANEKITPEETRASKKARLAQVYDRGVVADRLHVELPPDLYGEWVPNNTVSIHTKENLGFRIDEEYARKRALHDKGDGASYVGDCVFMVCSAENKELLDEVRKDRYEKIHAPRGGKQKEERDFQSGAAPETAPKIESKVHVARPSDISNAIRAAGNNT